MRPIRAAPCGSSLPNGYQFFEPNLIRNYETPQLLNEKEVLIEDLKQKNRKSSATSWWMLTFLILSLITIIYYFKRQLLYKKRFNNFCLFVKLPVII